MKEDGKIFDVIIVGGGPTGINCAIACEKEGLSYIILEKGVLVNSIYHFPFNMTFFSTSKKLEIGNIPFISHNEKPTRTEALEYYRRIIEAFDIKILLGEKVNHIHKDKDIFQVITDETKYQSSHVILCTGFYDNPRMLNVPGEELTKVKHYYDDVHLYIQKKVVVIGGANSACDVALECWQKGAEVTMVVREKELYQKVKYWILPNIQNRIAEGSIKAYFESEIIKINENSVIISTPNGNFELPNDYVLAMTGYKPHMEWFETLGVSMTEDKTKVVIDDETLETSMAGLYMAGVAVAGLATSELFIENTRNHPKLIVHHIKNKMNK